ncbi:PPC domain-containing DNA-binding protein [Variovorax sp. CF079]|uniref:PPC domain-containing DNA-binding protein n=1 Tax=Variovorax sp. CF079 TaxID=1882774 RepID=UPI000B84DD8F|nr:PPC domain-containing DNA-binding protein [Variovorax sp. CF079]
MHQLPVRLLPGCDLRLALESLGRDQFQDGAFVLCGIGSLIDPKLRLAGESEESRYEGPFEILTLSGTVTRQGAHLHMSIASSEGHVRGGHVVYGNVIRTTAELLLVQAPEWELLRERDAATGFLELVASRRQVKDKP